MDYSPQIQTSSYFYGCRKFATDGMSVQRIKGTQISIRSGKSAEPAGHADFFQEAGTFLKAMEEVQNSPATQSQSEDSSTFSVFTNASNFACRGLTIRDVGGDQVTMSGDVNAEMIEEIFSQIEKKNERRPHQNHFGWGKDHQNSQGDDGNSVKRLRGGRITMRNTQAKGHAGFFTEAAEFVKAMPNGDNVQDPTSPAGQGAQYNFYQNCDHFAVRGLEVAEADYELELPENNVNPEVIQMILSHLEKQKSAQKDPKPQRSQPKTQIVIFGSASAQRPGPELGFSRHCAARNPGRALEPPVSPTWPGLGTGPVEEELEYDDGGSGIPGGWSFPS
ncbi:hypothetical protein D9758_010861 [Tetrapyrgos nigripes]|uniref:Uncharacterized protein n=1 Tax=Tetrapyrgos nigripes TaxID=182062 RepID=A0A8H5GIA8_9AGAR|nr:hypothetical protein D9758_010861 [Tetrapyrgos nigripes]